MAAEQRESPAAQLAKKRWKGKTEEERSEHMRMMVRARWKKAKAKKKK